MSTRPHSLRRGATVGTAILFALACQDGPGNLRTPLVWPNAALNGSTVAMGIGGNAFPIDPADLPGTQNLERYDLSVENVSLRVADDSASGSTDVTPRSVFEARTDDPVVTSPPRRTATGGRSSRRASTFSTAISRRSRSALSTAPPSSPPSIAEATA